jgi:hypothetical protein
MITKLKSGYVWEYSENDRVVTILRSNLIGEASVVAIPRVKARSLLCFLNRVAWHKDKKIK